MKNAVVEYKAPSFASSIQHIPSKKCNLINGPTPITPFSFSSSSDKFELFIKRDDLTESVASGNKIRKLEFIMADVIDQNSDCVITIGGTGSNHCRTVAQTCARLGIPCHLILRKDKVTLFSLSLFRSLRIRQSLALKVI